MKPARIGALWLAGTLLAGPAMAARVTLSGTVRDRESKAGVAGLTVTLTPPKGSGQARVATTTDQEGTFALGDVASGPYLLEVLQGTRVVHREEIALERDTQKDVELRR